MRRKDAKRRRRAGEGVNVYKNKILHPPYLWAALQTGGGRVGVVGPVKLLQTSLNSLTLY